MTRGNSGKFGPLFRERTTAVPKFHVGTLKIIVGILWGFCLGELGVLNINLTLELKIDYFHSHLQLLVGL